MRVYLVQHAEAKREEEDPSRPLTEKGLNDAKKMAKYAKERLRIQVDQIFHSGRLRAQQTAEILAEHPNPPKGVAAVEGLEPMADPKVWKTRLSEATADTMLVGHLPHLSKLAASLLCEDESREPVAFKMAGIVCLEKNSSNRWTIQWMVVPEIA